jgi:hypothetical protein
LKTFCDSRFQFQEMETLWIRSLLQGDKWENTARNEWVVSLFRYSSS